MSATDSGVETGTEESNDSMSVESHSSDHSPLNSNNHDNNLRTNNNHAIPDHAQEESIEVSTAEKFSVISSYGQPTVNDSPFVNISQDISLASCSSTVSSAPMVNFDLSYNSSESNPYQINLNKKGKMESPNLSFLSSRLVDSYNELPFYEQRQHSCKIRAYRLGYISRDEINRYRDNAIFPRLRAILGGRKIRVAANNNNVDGVRELLMSGVNPSSTDEKKRTPLHMAASQGYTDVVKLLLEFRANPNAKDTVGNTPLHLATIRSHVEVITLLLKAGTDVKTLDNRGRTPLQLAEARLKRIQSDNFSNSSQLKIEIMQVVEMMQAYLQKSGQVTEADLLNMFTDRLNLRQTREEVDTDVQELLSSLNHLSLEKTDS